jgi:hypothetical protein
VVVVVGRLERNGRVDRSDSGDRAIDENVDVDDGVIVRDIGTARRLGIGAEKRGCARSMRLRGGIRGIFLYLSADDYFLQGRGSLRRVWYVVIYWL